MNDVSLPSDFGERLSLALDARDPRPAFTATLRDELLRRASLRSPRPRRGLRPALALLLLTLLLLAGAILAVGPERAWAAMRRLLGYIPGIGFVDDSSTLLALDAPVAQTRDGVTLKVNQVIADPSRTILLYQVDGLSIDAANSQGEGAANLGSLGSLVPPDGTELEQNGGDGSGWGTGYTMRLIFPRLPPGVDAVTFRLPRLNDMPPGAAPENWELALRLKPAPPSLAVAPVLEVTPSAAIAGGEGSPGSGPYGISLNIEKVATLGDGYLVVGSTRWDSSARFPQGLMPTGLMTVHDAVGREIPLQQENPDVGPETAGNQRFPWVYRLQGQVFDGPLTFSLDSVDAWLPTNTSFVFDAGPRPQVGQTWNLDQQLEVASHLVTLRAARMVSDSFGTGYEFTFASDPDVSSLALAVPSAPPAGGGGGGGMGEFTASMMWPGAPPVGAIDLKIEGIGLILHGPWQVTWQPPAPAALPSPSPTPSAKVCLTLEAGRPAAKYANSALTQELSGHLLLYGPMEGHPGYVLNLASLGGSERTYIGEGTWPSFSPDGSRVVFSGTDGLYVRRLAAGTAERLPGTNQNDYHPLWSPLGDRIAFVRGAGAFDLFVIGAQGGDLKKVTSGPEYEELAGWMPDGERIVYSAVGEGGLGGLRSVDIVTGEVGELFRFEGRVKSVGAAVSPDGEWVVYRDILFGNSAGGLFISHLDGSARRLLAALGAGGMSSSVWRPDATWLAARLPAGEPGFDPPVPILFQPTTCQLIVLANLTGEVLGWAP